jgi:hypothetical protein
MNRSMSKMILQYGLEILPGNAQTPKLTGMPPKEVLQYADQHALRNTT